MVSDQIESVTSNYGRDLGKLQWRKLSGEGNGIGLVTPYGSLLVPSPGKLCPGILKGGEREVVHGTPGDVR